MKTAIIVVLVAVGFLACSIALGVKAALEPLHHIMF